MECNEINKKAERDNFIYWYSTAVEDDLKTAKSLHRETYDRLMARYAKEAEIIDKLFFGKARER